MFYIGDNFYPLGVQSSNDNAFNECWRDVFLKHANLQVPWKMVLGNHDYMKNPIAQIDYHSDSVNNQDKLWHMPSLSYSFSCHVRSHTTHGMLTRIDFHALDTNGCQRHVTRMFPALLNMLDGFITQLHSKLLGSNAQWRIVFGHHPMYTQGREHGNTGRHLRGSTDTTSPSAEVKVGHPSAVRRQFGLEDVLVDGAVQAYFSGHEHVFQVQQPSLIAIYTVL